MDDEFLLLNPGPVPMSPDAREAMSEPMVSHRSAAFEAVYERAQDGLEYVFEQSSLDGERTASGGEALILNGTATMGMEAAVANLVDADDELVAVVNGKFGRRFKRIAERHCTVTAVEFEWGAPIDVGAVADAVSDETAVVTVVHNETSTGLLNPVEEIGEIAADHDARFVVDGVTSIGGDTFRIDDWEVDIAITDGQKALAAPPGVAALYVADGVDAHVDGESAPFYEDLDWHSRKASQHQTPFTSAVPLFRGLAVAVEEIETEGIPDRIARHRRQSTAFREAMWAMGLESFPELNDATAYSNTLTAIELPEGARDDDSEAFFDAVADRGVSISGGQAHLGGEIFRVSNMGNITDEQLLRGIRTIGEAFDAVGVDVAVPDAVETAREALDR